MKLGCRAIEIATGDVYHITGCYESREQRAEALLEYGYVVLSWWEVM